MFCFHISVVFLTTFIIHGQSTDTKYVVVDGIEVLREDYEAFVKNVDGKTSNSKKKTREELDMEKEYELEQQEDNSIGKNLPNKHHGKQ